MHFSAKPAINMPNFKNIINTNSYYILTEKLWHQHHSLMNDCEKNYRVNGKGNDELKRKLVKIIVVGRLLLPKQKHKESPGTPQKF
jgi:hypothetical protein